MARIWLPIHERPTTGRLLIKEPTTGREMLVIIPGASHMDRGQLEAIIEGQTERTLEQLKAQGPKPVARLSKAEVQGALREFVTWRNKRREDIGWKGVF